MSILSCVHFFSRPCNFESKKSPVAFSSVRTPLLRLAGCLEGIWQVLVDSHKKIHLLAEISARFLQGQHISARFLEHKLSSVRFLQNNLFKADSHNITLILSDSLKIFCFLAGLLHDNYFSLRFTQYFSFSII